MFDGNKYKNDETDPAKYVVDNFYEAIKLIFKLEKLENNVSITIWLS